MVSPFGGAEDGQSGEDAAKVRAQSREVVGHAEDGTERAEHGEKGRVEHHADRTEGPNDRL